MAQMTPELEAHVSQPVTSPPVSPQPASPETARLTDEDILDYAQAIAPLGSPAQYLESPLEEAEPGEVVTAVLTEEDSPSDPVADKLLERHQILTDQVSDWLKSKDPHKFWRQFVAGACNKNLSYNTWPQEYQTAFNERFGAMLTDSNFLSTLCGRIVKMQNGHLVAPHVAGAFVTVMAGFLSFALIEV